MTHKNDALPVVAWEVSGGDVRSKVYEQSPDWTEGSAYTVRELTYLDEALATRDAELADLRAVSDACSNSLADKCREVVQLQAELAALRDFVLHVKKCITKNGEYAPLSTQSIDEALGLSPTDAAPLVSDKAGADSNDKFYAGLYLKSSPMWRELHDMAASKGYDHVRYAIECAPVYKCDCMGARKMALDLEGRTVPCECVAGANDPALNPLAADVAQGGGEKP